jgi:hypothetical protein
MMCAISAKLQKLKLMIEEREIVALATTASEMKWLLDILDSEFNEAWLSEHIPDAALDIVAQGLPAAPISNEVSTPLRLCLHPRNSLGPTPSFLKTNYSRRGQRVLRQHRNP